MQTEIMFVSHRGEGGSSTISSLSKLFITATSPLHFSSHCPNMRLIYSIRMSDTDFGASDAPLSEHSSGGGIHKSFLRVPQDACLHHDRMLQGYTPTADNSLYSTC